MNIRLTTLCENTVGMVDALAEWGLSILIEADGKKILFDTGQRGSVTQNAAQMKLSLVGIDTIVLSHGHYDHTGGLRDVLTGTGKMEILAHPDIWKVKYAMRPGGKESTYVGIPFQPAELEKWGALFRYSKEPIWITDRIVTTGEIPMVTPYESIDSNLFVKEGDALLPDPVADDQAIIIKADFGLVVILGCAHRGTVNTLKHAQKITGIHMVHTVIGGTHLFRASREQIEQTIAELKQFGVQKLGVSHCTGMNAALRLWQEFDDHFFFNNAGTVVNLP